jgi:hypothetical protein
MKEPKATNLVTLVFKCGIFVKVIMCDFDAIVRCICTLTSLLSTTMQGEGHLRELSLQLPVAAHQGTVNTDTILKDMRLMKGAGTLEC